MADSGRFGRQSVLSMLSKKTLTTGGATGAAPGAVPFEPAAEKYAVQGTVGSGGMGEVLLVLDHDLRRQLAMKVMLPQAAAYPEARLKFVAEAQATSQLEHPGIPPVHDLGITSDGVPYFTMKLVRGRTLREVLHDLLLGRKEVRREYSLHRLVTVLERICEAVHFAHELGVVHRDLKPDNVMLGDYGEVHVMDWGIAKVVHEEVETEDRLTTAETDAGLKTVDGAIKGTIPYMSPEQAAGRTSEVNRRTDVYALGCILYEILALHPAFDGERLQPRVVRGDYPPVRARNPKRPIPEDLAALCDRCMALDRDARPESAREVAADLRSWLDGTSERDRRHGEAEGLAAKGREAAARFAKLRSEVAAAEAAAEEQEAKYKPWQSVEEKGPALDARVRCTEARRAAARAFAETTRFLEAALLSEEANPTARTALADLWRDRLREAEARGDADEAAHALDLVARYDDGRLARVISGDGSLFLTSEPPGAEVALHRFEDRRGVLQAGPAKPLGRCPVGPVELPMGSYLCVLRLKGFRDARYPIHITRNHSWTGHVRMLTDGDVGEGFVCVPGGPFVYGDGRGVSIRELPDFAIARYPVTFGEYLEFVADVERTQSLEEARRRLPQTPGDGPYAERTPEGVYRPLASIVEGPARERCLREHGPDFLLRVPVMAVSWEDAAAWCEWKARATGREWRLPTEEEREKAARGVDGRVFPWGDLEEPSLGKCRDSRDERSQPEPVGAFPTSVSVYGMGDAVGGMWDWTASWFDSRQTMRVLRGGAWVNPSVHLRCTHRNRYEPGYRNTHLGFRPARSLA